MTPLHRRKPAERREIAEQLVGRIVRVDVELVRGATPRSYVARLLAVPHSLNGGTDQLVISDDAGATWACSLATVRRLELCTIPVLADA